MVRFIQGVVVLACLAGCKRDVGAGGAPPAPGVHPATSRSVLPSTPDAGFAGVLPLSPQQVEAYVAYQRVQVALTLEGLQDLQRVADGGEDDPALQAQLYPAMKARAAKDEAARRASGLSFEELRYLEQLVTEVVGKRSFAKGVNFDAQIQKMKALRGQLPEEQRASLDQSLARLEADQKDLVELREQRQKFGDANVDLVLRHEAELSENLRRSLEAFGRKSTGR